MNRSRTLRATRAAMGITVAVITAWGAAASPAAATGRSSAGTRTAVVAATTSRVTTWNLFAPGDHGPGGYARTISELKGGPPDVIGLEEACRAKVADIQSLLKTKYNLTYNVAYGTVMNDRANCGFWGGNAYGQAILSRTPISDAKNTIYNTKSSEPRGYMSVTTTVGGKRVRVFATHLAEGDQSKERAGQVSELLKATNSYSQVIVLGDFNAVPESTELAPIWKVFVDADPNCGPKASPACRATANASPARKKFDYILVRRVTRMGWTSEDSWLSDHDVVTATLRS